MAAFLGRLLLAALAAALQRPVVGLAATRTAPAGPGEDLEKLQAQVDAVDAKNASEVAELAAALAKHRGGEEWPHRKQKQAPTAEPRPEVDERVRRWLDEASKAPEDSEEELESGAGEPSSDSAEEVAKSEEEEKLDRLSDLLDEVNTKNASDVSRVGDSLVARAAALRALGPPKKVKRHRRLRRARRASKRTKEAIAKEMEQWASEAEKATSSMDEEFSFYDRQLLEQLDNITKEQAALTAPEADQELAILQGIWDRYGLDDENATAMDVVERLERENNTWLEDALERLRPINRTEPEEVRELRQTVEKLQGQLAEAKQAAHEAKSQADQLAAAQATVSRRAALRRRAAQALAAALHAHIRAKQPAAAAHSGGAGGEHGGGSAAE